MAGQVSIDRAWWEHLTPTPMHKLRGEVERQLRAWCQTDYGTFWLSSAREPGGVIRIKAGDAIPDFHVVAMRNGLKFVTPQKRMREGHRNVSIGTNEYKSGKAQQTGELILSPVIRLDLVTDPALMAAASRLDINMPSAHVSEPSILFSVPSHVLIAPNGLPKKSFVLYQHIFGEGGSYPVDGHFYVGITTRSWKTRWAEHRRAMRKGSKLLFHRKLREELEAKRVTYIHHKVMAVTTDVEALYEAEEALVAGHWEDTRRLNMIPGGRTGYRYLRRANLVAASSEDMPNDRYPAVPNWLGRNPDRPLPPT
jgi:hypothetical protein